MISDIPCNDCGSHYTSPNSEYSFDDLEGVLFKCGMCDSTNNIQQQLALQRQQLAMDQQQQQLTLQQQQLALEQQRQQLALDQQRQQLALDQQRQELALQEQEIAFQLPATCGATRLVLGAVTPTGVAFRAMTSEDVFAARGSAQPRLVQGYREPSGQSICNAYREQDAQQNSNGGIRWARTNISPPGGFPFLNR